MNQLKNGQTVSIATKIDYGKGAGFLYVGPDGNLYVNPIKPSILNDKYLFKIEKPPQKSGGNEDLSTVYDGDDILLKSVYNGKYARIINNIGGSGIWHMNASETNAKYNYRDQGNGTMEALKINSTNTNQLGYPVYLDGKHTYSIQNPRLYVFMSYSPDTGVRTAGSANSKESWFFTDVNGHAI